MSTVNNDLSSYQGEHCQQCSSKLYGVELFRNVYQTLCNMGNTVQIGKIVFVWQVLLVSTCVAHVCMRKAGPTIWFNTTISGWSHTLNHTDAYQQLHLVGIL